MMKLQRFLLACGLSLLAIPVSPPARAAEVTVDMFNDDYAGSSRSDDLYTFGGSITVSFERWKVELEERGFTDRRARRRFDETYLVLSRTSEGLGGGAFEDWRITAGAGVVQVGHGLIGESVQNAWHRIIDEPEVRLRYLEDEVYAHLAFTAAGPRLGASALAPGPWADLEATLGFRTSLAAGLQWRWEPWPWLQLKVTGGARWTESDLAALEPWVGDVGFYGEVSGVLWRHVTARWSHNAFGTEDRHWRLGVRFSWGD